MHGSANTDYRYCTSSVRGTFYENGAGQDAYT